MTQVWVHIEVWTDTLYVNVECMKCTLHFVNTVGKDTDEFEV